MNLSLILAYIFYFFSLYFLGLWVFQDADRRGVNGYFWSLVCIFFPIAGIPFYLFLRPKSIIKKCPDCERFSEKDTVLCYYCPHNTFYEKATRPPFWIYVFSLARGLLYSAFMTVKYFIFMSFNGLYEKIFILRTEKLYRMDRVIKRHYFLKNPVRIAKKTEMEMDMPYFALTYGETPYSTAIKIFDLLKPSRGDVFFDLGSGIGQLVFFVNLYYGIPSAGIEIVPFFVKKSRAIKRELELDNVEFIEGDFLREDLSSATILYMNGKAFNVDIIEKILEKFKKLKQGVKVISIGYPIILSEFSITGKRTEFFSWGWDDIFIQEKIF